ncbi:MAG: antitoxin [Desulfuromonadaceae bacterium]|nr:antitoxin [Desulfuromonadaceae bacterium]
MLSQYVKIYQATLAKWGEEAQYDQAIEECAELIVGIKHLKRKRISEEVVIDELADVALMVGQLTWMLGADKVERAIERKLEKLHSLLKE